MKILLVHTFYQQPGGEDNVFEQEKDLLGSSEQLDTLTFFNKSGWKGAVQFIFSIWNIFSSKKIQNRIKIFQPDVIHIHNWHFASGPAIIRAARKTKVPVVVTLHNYRLLCPSATLLYGNQLFTESINALFPWKAIIKKVYRRSYVQTFYLALIVWVHKIMGTWNGVDKYILLTDFAKDLFIHSPFRVLENKFVVKPNFVVRVERTNVSRNKNFLFVGRLSEEKGINVLLKAFIQSGYLLNIAGDGPLKQLVQQVADENKNIVYLGKLTRQEIDLAMSTCTALVFPSIWYEGMPMTLIEAFASGTPVIASNLGAMSSMVQHRSNGLHFESSNIDSLRIQLDYWVKLSEVERKKYQENAIQAYNKYYTPEISKTKLIDIYQSVVEKGAN